MEWYFCGEFMVSLWIYRGVMLVILTPFVPTSLDDSRGG
jgi:hypothetical protein